MFFVNSIYLHIRLSTRRQKR